MTARITLRNILVHWLDKYGDESYIENTLKQNEKGFEVEFIFSEDFKALKHRCSGCASDERGILTALINS